MKFINSKTIASLLVLGAMSIGTASAAIPEGRTVPLTGVIGVQSTDLTIRIKDGVATLFGDVETRGEAALAKSYVEKLEGVDKVRNLVVIN